MTFNKLGHLAFFQDVILKETVSSSYYFPLLVANEAVARKATLIIIEILYSWEYPLEFDKILFDFYYFGCLQLVEPFQLSSSFSLLSSWQLFINYSLDFKELIDESHELDNICFVC